MAITYQIFPHERAIALRLTGALSLVEITGAVRMLWADPDYSREYCGIADITDASLRIEMCDFRALLNFLVHHEKLSVAPWVAVGTSPVAVGCATAYRALMRAHHKFDIVPTWAEACKSLGRNLPPLTATSSGPPPGTSHAESDASRAADSRGGYATSPPEIPQAPQRRGAPSPNAQL